ncbi:MAG: penicillin-binding protein 2 [Spirochaetaceae bacterium]|jgi:penicillin-binding protein 2|nr:penicillin-binding protein 2 [Spirochaetaceae bacterium]
MHHLDEEKGEKRITILQAAFIAFFVFYAFRLFSMQVLHREQHQKQAEDITKRATVIPAQRGEIYDRNFSAPVVYNVNSFTIYISPAEIPQSDMQSVLTLLGGILDMTVPQIERRLPAQYHYLFQPVEIASNVSYETIAALAENASALPGVSWQSKPVRNYDNTGSLSHIIGYVGDITRDELTVLYNKGYQSGDIIGKAGIEKQYNELLKGKDGTETRIVDVRGREARDRDIIRNAPEIGKNLVLTIDSKIQTLAQKALGERIGAVVVTRPTTGEVLAMVSYPWYNADIFNKKSDGADYQAMINDPNRPLINRAIQSSYPPGSTFKVVMTAGIIAENAYPIEKTVECPGEIWYGDRFWNCHIRKPGHGRLSLQRALAQSCDIYYWVVGRDYLGVERIVHYAKEFGYGELTGIDLPGEIAGIIPTPQWKDRRVHQKWQGGDTMNMSIGQGYTLVTPLQVANMVSLAVNDGVIYKPYILKEIRDPLTGEVEKTTTPEVLKKSDIDKAIFEMDRQYMRSVISEGTARYPLNIRSVEIAGKTGTSEVGLKDRWHSWFSGFAPYKTDNPDERVVVSIIVEAINNWEWWAVYASAIIFQGIFAGQTYEQAAAALGFQRLFPSQERRD